MWRRRRPSLLPALALAICGCCWWLLDGALATVIFASPSGGPSPCGAVDSPCSWTAAVALAHSGDTVALLTGVYELEAAATLMHADVSVRAYNSSAPSNVILRPRGAGVGALVITTESNWAPTTVSLTGVTFEQFSNVSVIEWSTQASTALLLLSECVFKDNRFAAGRGAAVHVRQASAVLANCAFVNNSADLGGAVYSEYYASFSMCLFSDNLATESGGAIAGSEIVLDRCVFQSNSNAAVYAESGTVTANLTTWETNDGVAVYGWQSVQLTDCLLLNNRDDAVESGLVVQAVNSTFISYGLDYAARALSSNGSVIARSCLFQYDTSPGGIVIAALKAVTLDRCTFEGDSEVCAGMHCCGYEQVCLKTCCESGQFCTEDNECVVSTPISQSQSWTIVLVILVLAVMVMMAVVLVAAVAAAGVWWWRKRREVLHV